MHMLYVCVLCLVCNVHTVAVLNAAFCMTCWVPSSLMVKLGEASYLHSVMEDAGHSGGGA